VDIRGIAEQTLVGDFNRNNKMSLKKYILFSRSELITIYVTRMTSLSRPGLSVRSGLFAPVRAAAAGRRVGGTISGAAEGVSGHGVDISGYLHRSRGLPGAAARMVPGAGPAWHPRLWVDGRGNAGRRCGNWPTCATG